MPTPRHSSPRRLAVGFLALLPALVGLTSTLAAQEPDAALLSRFAGSWHGEMSLGGEAVEVVVTLVEAQEPLTGHLAVPERELAGLELAGVTVEDSVLSFNVPALGSLEFSGRLVERETDSGGPPGEVLRGETSEPPAPAPPSSDVYLLPLEDAAEWAFGATINATDRDGYDNQPYFLPDSSAILYTSIRGGQSDIYRYTLASGERARQTDTAESEYSPTPMPGGESFSVIQVEADGTQRLWSFPMAGGAPSLLLEELRPVGYHAWLDDVTVATFILGDPLTLQVAHLDTGAAKTIAQSIGRSLHRVPGRAEASYVHKAEGGWWISAFDPWRQKVRTLAPTREGSEDFVWTPDGRIMMGEGSKLFEIAPGHDGAEWREVADLEAHGIHGITRLALAPDGSYLAVVGERPPSGPPPEPVVAPVELRRTEG